MFKDAKAGDIVWSVINGWGKIEIFNIKSDYPLSDYPLEVKFNRTTESYTLDGKNHALSLYPTLYWDKIEITPPPKPKKKVIKIVEYWMNTYENEENCIHETKEIADKNAAECRIACVKLTGEYEVEE